MYECKFVKTSLGGIFCSPTHRGTITFHATEGWKLVQVLPLEFNGQGKPTSYEIIFERFIQAY